MASVVQVIHKVRNNEFETRQYKISSRDPTTALAMSIQASSKETEQRFLEENPDVQTHKNYQLLTASKIGKYWGVLDLLDAGTDIDSDEKSRNHFLGSSSNFNETPIHLACYYNHVDIVQLLARAGANVNIPNSYQQTPLRTASMKGFNNIITILKYHGADVNAVDKWSTTPLFIAVRCAHVETVELLLSLGADKTIATQDGKTPIDEARSPDKYSQLFRSPEKCSQMISLLE